MGHLAVEKDLQGVITRRRGALVYVDKVEAEEGAHGVRVHTSGSCCRDGVRRAAVIYKVGDRRLVYSRHLIDVAIASQVYLTRSHIVNFKAGSGHDFILHTQAVLVTLRAGVALFENVEVSSGLGSCRIERRSHRTERDTVQCRIVVEGRELPRSAVLRKGVAPVVDSAASAH